MHTRYESAPCAGGLCCLADRSRCPPTCTAHESTVRRQRLRSLEALGGGKEQLSKSTNLSGCSRGTYQSFSKPARSV